MARVLNIDEFIIESQKLPVVDTRSPSEFSTGHFPGAINIPLLDDDIRKQVGTIYKQKGREEAVELAFKLTGPKFYDMIREAKDNIAGKEVLLYCWRGGLRSNTMAWILSLSGFNVGLLKGGYKSFRTWVLEQFSQERKIIILGGKTGSGKTEVIQCLHAKGVQVIDLEKLASHKGSAFGALGMKPQPTNQHFENMLAIEWSRLNPEQFVILENESRQVGLNIIPEPVFTAMRNAPVIELDLDASIRAQRIMEDYGKFPVPVLSEITQKLQKRLGPKETRDAVQFLAEGNLKSWLEIVLSYYDKFYSYGMSIRDPQKTIRIASSFLAPEKNATLVQEVLVSHSSTLNECIKQSYSIKQNAQSGKN